MLICNICGGEYNEWLKPYHEWSGTPCKHVSGLLYRGDLCMPVRRDEMIAIKQMIDGTYSFNIDGRVGGCWPTFREALAQCVAELIRGGFFRSAIRLLECELAPTCREIKLAEVNG